jgi:hypothetical protein
MKEISDGRQNRKKTHLDHRESLLQVLDKFRLKGSVDDKVLEDDFVSGHGCI